MSGIHYTTAQICLNGHVITAYADSTSRQKKFCQKCGEPTITNCPDTTCGAKIAGKQSFDMAPVIEDLKEVPGFCHNCGKAYPWTERKAAALAEAIDETELPEADREKLKQSIPDVIQDTPKTQTAASRFGKAIGSAGQWSGKLLTEVLTKVATGAALTMSGLKP
jgi:hypothetical protein